MTKPQKRPHRNPRRLFKLARKPGVGRPKGPLPALTTFTFRLDASVRRALDCLARQALLTMPGIKTAGARGVAIRRAILITAAQLDEADTLKPGHGFGDKIEKAGKIARKILRAGSFR